MPIARPSGVLPRGYKEVFAHQEFRRFVPAVAASDVGDGMSVVAVAWLAIQVAPQGSVGPYVGVAVASYVLPGAVGALLFTRWLQRLPARRLLGADACVRAVFLGGVPTAWILGELSPELYVALLAGSSLLHAWGRGAKFALVAQLLPHHQRLAGNALLSTSVWASTLVGPTLAGVLTSVIAPAWIIGLDAVSFAFLAIQLGRIQVPDVPTLPRAHARLRDGLRVVLTSPELLGLLAVTWLFALFWGPVTVALPVFVAQELQGGASLLGLYWSLFGLGAVAGALAAGSLRRLPLWPVMIFIIAGHGLAMLPFALPGPAVVSMVGFALGGVIYGPYNALSFTRFQDRTPASWLTTVLAFRAAVLLTASPIGAALAGPLTAAAGPRWVLAGTGVAMIFLACLATGLVRAHRPAGPVPARHPGAGELHPVHDSPST
jgi:predicted MFS family arabinose efflux permease